MKKLLVLAPVLATLAQPASAGELTPPLPSTAAIYEQTTVFRFHPATLALSNVPPSGNGDHPAVIVAKRPASLAAAPTPSVHPALWR